MTPILLFFTWTLMGSSQYFWFKFNLKIFTEIDYIIQEGKDTLQCRSVIYYHLGWW